MIVSVLQEDEKYQIAIRRFDDLEYEIIYTAESFLVSPNFSPGNDWIGFSEIDVGFSGPAKGTLKKISFRGGPAVPIGTFEG